MSYLIAIGSTVCGTTAIMATGPIIKAKKSEIAYAVANMTVFGIIAMNGTISAGDLFSSRPANIKNVDKVFRSTVT